MDGYSGNARLQRRLRERWPGNHHNEHATINTPPASFSLYSFGIIAAIIAGLLIAFFLVFKRHRVTHARLKIDLEAVHSEAGRIESSEFFQSVKDQVRKEKDE